MGEKMGFTGEDLSAFVEKERQVITAGKERIQHEHERELVLQLEKEQLLLEREKLQRDERAMSRAHEKEMKELDISQGRPDHIPLPVENKSKPKLTPFDERRDNMDSYLNRFERYATCNQWLEEEWANILSALLTGKALEVYSRLDFDAANDYQSLKQALLRRFRLNDEGFRMKFRNAKIEADESCIQFIARLRNYLSRWVELSDTVKTYDGLCDLLLREQFLMTCSRPLSVFLKERKLKNSVEMANVADQYAEAHGGLGSSESRDRTYNGRGVQKDSSSNVHSGASVRRSCYLCGKPNHLFRDCPVRKQYKKETFVGNQKLGAIKEVTESSSVGSCMDMRTRCRSGHEVASECEVIQGKDLPPAEKVNTVAEGKEAKMNSLPVLLYGRTVRGPMSILYELWTNEKTEPDVKSTYQYVVELRERLEDTCKLAKAALGKAAKKYKKYYDARSKDRRFTVGDEVLVLLPTDHNKLLLQWKGPYKVSAVRGQADYQVQMEDKERILHANLLKRYVKRVEGNEGTACTDALDDNVNNITRMPTLEHVATAVVEMEDEDHEITTLELPTSQSSEKYTDVQIGPLLNDEQKKDLQDLLEEFQSTLTDIPGRTDLVYHQVKLTSDAPVRSKPYPVPHVSKEHIDLEIQKMIKLGVIEPSTSPYASPVVLVRKSDGSLRFCIDFRKLNAITVFDAEPQPIPEELFTRLSTGKYFSKLDLAKGYWQIPLEEEACEKTAFVTTEGHYQFRVMPFGMVNAAATFTRMMRILLAEIPSLVNLIDDILIYTETWEEHLKVLRQKIREAPEPRTKKELRSFIGLASYYRKFIPDFAAVAVPLTDLTKKSSSNHLRWEAAQQNAFDTLKSKLSTDPILKLPDFTKTFFLRIDASDVGIGSILLQKHGEQLFPVAYASRKLCCERGIMRS
ncbi:uncharacterized protein [Haliotis asinina]|uniref:uncharacterized protein n=1 Tax=Haliotis asinina TaxID=109174 RepID=UPI00353267BD